METKRNESLKEKSHDQPQQTNQASELTSRLQDLRARSAAPGRARDGTGVHEREQIPGSLQLHRRSDPALRPQLGEPPEVSRRPQRVHLGAALLRSATQTGVHERRAERPPRLGRCHGRLPLRRRNASRVYCVGRQRFRKGRGGRSWRPSHKNLEHRRWVSRVVFK